MKTFLPIALLAVTLLGCSKAEEPAATATPAASSAAPAPAANPTATPAAAPAPAADPQIGGTATKPGEAGPP